MRELAVQIEGLSYKFGEQTVLKDISLELEQGKIYGLLGRNSSGKTTLINLLVNQLIAPSCKLHIFGEDPRKKPEILRRVCIVREEGFYAPYMKGYQILDLYQRFYEHYDKALEARLVELFEVPVKKPYSKYSRGMKSILLMIVALASKADLVILDEPTLGMDTPNREAFYKILLEEYIKQPRTFIISTHFIDEVENIIEEAIILEQGEKCLQEEVEVLKQKAMYLSGHKEVLESLEGLKGKEPKECFGSKAVYAYIGALSEADTKKVKIGQVECLPMSLGQIFLEMTRRKEV